MADSFFGFDTSLSNLNDDEGGGEPSEDEYDALNDETFGQDTDDFDWEVEHEHLAEQLESSRRNNSDIDDAANSQLEASLSQLVLDETDEPQLHSTLGSSVWRHDVPTFPTAPTSASTLKNVCTVEELERQLRQKQVPQQQQQTCGFPVQNYFQPRFPVILQRPPGLQAPVQLPFSSQPTMVHNMNQLNKPLNNVIGQNNQINHINQPNQLLGNQTNKNIGHIGQNMNQLGQNMNQMSNHNMINHLGHNANQFMQNTTQMTSNQFPNNQMGQSNLVNPMSHNMQNIHHIGQTNQLLQNSVTQNMNKFTQNVNQLGQNINHLGPNITQMNQNMNHQNFNQLGQNVNQLGQNMNSLNQNVNKIVQKGNQISTNQVNHQSQMVQNGNQFGPIMNQYSQIITPPRMMAPPPGLNMPRQNFAPNIGQYNPNIRAPTILNHEQQSTVNQPQQQNMLLNQQLMQQQISNQALPIGHNIVKATNQPLNQPTNQSLNQPTNQSQVQSSQNQKNQKTDTKLQKRVQPLKIDITSDHFAQLLEKATRRLMKYSNSFHNASHHPILNRNNAFGNTQFGNNPMFNNHRQNGLYNNSNQSMMNGDDVSVGSDTDEYAGLMTSREKQWLINIQILQLNTGTPYIHDFYYTVFLERQSKKEKEGVKEAHKANQQNHPFYSGAVKQEGHSIHGRERHNSARHNSTSEDPAPRTYVPTQFENSLGKLQCGSVTAPRKIIDLEVVSNEPASTSSRAPSVASTTNPEAPREIKRTKQVLLDIEALYLILLRLEELNDPLAISNALILKEREEKQKQLEAAQKEASENDLEEDTNLFLRNIESVQRRPKQESPKTESIDKRQVVNLAVNQKPPVKNLLDENKDDLVNKMFAGLLHSDRLGQILNVRKGRTMVRRFLSRVSPTHVRLRTLWSRVLRALPSAARRDDGTLAPLATYYRKYIHNTSGWTAILESCSLLSEALDPARTPYALTTAFTLSCVCALTEKASALVNTPEATSSERQWSKFLKTIARALKNTTLNVAKPIQPLHEAKLIYHIKQLESRSTIEILQRGKTAAEFADLTKNDVSEQLIKHLC